MKPDFSGFVTKANIQCTDGLTIMPDAFAHQDKQRVPLVWQHIHNDVGNVLGHVDLIAKDGGMYGEAYLNETPGGKAAKEMVQHGDVDSLSIYANRLVRKVDKVFHGAIREVSLVMAGANPEAKIDFVNIAHADGTLEEVDSEAIISLNLAIEHAEGDDGEETVGDVYASLSEKQKDVVNHMITMALESNDDDAEDPDGKEVTQSDKVGDDLTHQEGIDMTKNVFASEDHKSLSHSQMASVFGASLSHSDMEKLAHSVFDDFSKKKMTFKDAFLAHAGDYGITNIDALFPDAKNVQDRPEWITRKMEWVDGVLNGTRKLPFTRIKSRSADLTHEEARARGYIKGNLKKEQFFEIQSRETTPVTIYKKQRLDRDDIIDITEFDVVAWIWQEMRFMLREEIARAILIGDGRPVMDPANPGQPNPDKINELRIRPIATDDNFYTHRIDVAANTSASQLIEHIIRSRKHYKGSGNPTAFLSEDDLTDMLLLKDRQGRDLFESVDKLKAKLRVSDFVTPDIFDNVTDSSNNRLRVLLVNLGDYSIGTDKGGEITTFDDFDIDYNQYKYLIEGRMSGALTEHKRAVAVWQSSGTEATPTAPTFNSDTNTLTIPSVTGVTYFVDDVEASSGATVITADVLVSAEAEEGYYFAPGTVVTWPFTFNTEA